MANRLNSLSYSNIPDSDDGDYSFIWQMFIEHLPWTRQSSRHNTKQWQEVSAFTGLAQGRQTINQEKRSIYKKISSLRAENVYNSSQCISSQWVFRPCITWSLCICIHCLTSHIGGPYGVTGHPSCPSHPPHKSTHTNLSELYRCRQLVLTPPCLPIMMLSKLASRPIFSNAVGVQTAQQSKASLPVPHVDQSPLRVFTPDFSFAESFPYHALQMLAWQGLGRSSDFSLFLSSDLIPSHDFKCHSGLCSDVTFSETFLDAPV